MGKDPPHLLLEEGNGPEEKCSGCSCCVAICCLSHVAAINPSRSRIRIIRGEPAIDNPIFCRQCSVPKCVDACPVGAFRKDHEIGIHTIDEEICTGCGACLDACPFDGIFLDPVRNIAIRCDLCGGDPQCVKYCPTQVLKFEIVGNSSIGGDEN